MGDDIAEGFGRFKHKENIQACRIARGSLCETLNQVLNAKDENYISKETWEEFKLEFETTTTILNGYINYLKKAKTG
ncbi:four helix bundle protein [Gillisia limnaea]|uniref:four helix bundle protein n=1 Tax=Gillisia limnaea TaxID=195907 RepID=UPI001C2656D2